MTSASDGLRPSGRRTSPGWLEQHGYARLGVDGIADLRLVCSGWIPVPSPA
jgi:hypothetical protein